MVQTIHQSVTFDASPEDLFELYVDAKRHTDATGGGAAITPEVGATFTAWDGYIEGVNLGIVPGRLVVQSWRAADWTDDDVDSTLVLAFSRDADGKGRVDMVHANVPDDEADALDSGWHENYWEPWREYLESQ